MKIRFEDVCYTYEKGTANENIAVKNVSFCIEEPSFIALAGGTGSGKSTLIQMINALKLPESGKIYYDGKTVGADKKMQRDIRCRAGMVFQYPEYQFFEETVLKDTAFGPLNKGYDKKEAQIKAKEALILAGIGEDKFRRSPFELSGGEKRRCAIAGVIAMEPEILILDEPTAGLDPAGKKQILDLIRSFYDEKGTCVIMVSHNMDEIAEYAERVMVMHDGSLIMDGDVHDIFSREEELKKAGLTLPQACAFARSLGIEGTVTLEEAACQIAAVFGRNSQTGARS